MALIKKLIKIDRNSKVHNEIEATYNLVTRGNEKVVQITTYGSSNRKVQGAASQTIQLSEEVINQLKNIIDDEL